MQKGIEELEEIIMTNKKLRARQARAFKFLKWTDRFKAVKVFHRQQSDLPSTLRSLGVDVQVIGLSCNGENIYAVNYNGTKYTWEDFSGELPTPQ